MKTTPRDIERTLKRLEPLIGAWTIETDFPGATPAQRGGLVTFEWSLDGACVIQRSEPAWSEAPSSLSVVTANPGTDGFTQHYFDSRGVVRLYAMTFDGTLWTLVRDRPDFSPLDFWQRYIGRFTTTDTIEGAWEASTDHGATWTRDFGLTYRRA